MKSITRQATVPYSAQQMFDLINDVARYPEFIPHCTRAHVLNAGPTMMEAQLTFSKGLIQQTFTTRNRLTAPTEINMQLVDGPFQFLQGKWTIEPLNEGCHLALSLDFAFKNALLDLSFGTFFQQIGAQLVDCFSQRASQIYGA